ncbi:hypothetical protein AALP_AA8G199500 [Arabis alpina]|uniref:TIR domain-containing protein n=1 Tax=Arabis alpina TaxID=50452 RepID=A0A087G871_ARAAL|nr:hypothetical protein AALP_AA8G199500 [Arabis alpina]
MGRDIVHKQSFDEPGKRQFLMDTMEICDLFDENTGTGTVLGIMLHRPDIEEIEINESAFEGMNNLQFLAVYSNSLCIPKGKFLVEVIMRQSKLEKLWEGIKPLQCLKRMDLSHSEDLKEIPDLSKATNLEELDLYCCSGFLKLTNSIGNATKLKRLNLSGCWLLKELPFSIGNATNLQFLNLYCCTSLEELPSSIGLLINLEELELSCCDKLVTLPSIKNLHKLPVLNMSDCKELEVLPTNINLDSLTEIALGGCTRLKTFPNISTNIKELRLGYTAIEEVPLSINSWSFLYRLDMSECRNLKEFPYVPDSIVELELSKTGIEEVPPWIENLIHLCKLIMYGCKKLNNISPNVSKLENLEFLGLSIFWH